MWRLSLAQSGDWTRPDVGIGPGPMLGLGLVQCGDRARPKVEIGLGPVLLLCLFYKETGPIRRLDNAQSMDWAQLVVKMELVKLLVQVQCWDWAWSNVGIGPGPMWGLDQAQC